MARVRHGWLLERDGRKLATRPSRRPALVTGRFVTEARSPKKSACTTKAGRDLPGHLARRASPSPGTAHRPTGYAGRFEPGHILRTTFSEKPPGGGFGWDGNLCRQSERDNLTAAAFNP